MFMERTKSSAIIYFDLHRRNTNRSNGRVGFCMDSVVLDSIEVQMHVANL